MGRLVYSMLASLDGYVVDTDGNFDWANPGEDVHAFINDLERTIGTSLYGRRMYEVMAVWQDMPGLEQALQEQAGLDQPSTEIAVYADYAEVWRASDKIVYSTTLADVTTTHTTLERTFNPSHVRAFVSQSELDVSISGPTLAAHALRAGIVDDVHLFSLPVVVGGGTSVWPLGVRIQFELVTQHQFTDGTLHTHYRSQP